MDEKILQAMIAVLLIFLLAGCGAAAETADPTTTDTAAALEVTETTVEAADDVVSASAVVESETTVQQAEDDEIITEDTYIDIYEQLNPSVVNIRVVGAAVDLQSQFPDLFPEMPELPEDHPDFVPPQSVGSGFVYDADGHIVTNNHVVAGAERVVVTFVDGTEVEAEIVGTDPGSDLAVIKVDVEADSLRPVTLADSDTLRVGQLVAAIGNPFGLDGSMSTGIVSGLGRLLGSDARTPSGASFSIPNIIQTDTAINPGNSGGPLLNLDGEVVGVNTAIRSLSGGFQGIGYAVPANTVQQVVPQLIENGRIDYPWLGILGTTLNSDLAQAMDLDADQRGVLIIEVVDDSPADAANLQGSDETATIDGAPVDVGGDVIVAMNGEPIEDIDELIAYITAETAVGDDVTVQILRDGELQDVTVTMQARPVQE